LARLIDHRPGRREELAVTSPHHLLSLRAALPGHLRDPVNLPLDAQTAVAEHLAAEVGCPSEQALGTSQRAAQDAHPVLEQRAVGRVMDVGLDYCPIDAELTPTRH